MQQRTFCRRVSRLALILALAAIAAPVAQARHAPADPEHRTSTSAQIGAATRHHHPDVVNPPTRIVAVAAAGGFDWNDAAIGAAAAFGSALLVAGSALLLRRPKTIHRRAWLPWFSVMIALGSLVAAGGASGGLTGANVNSNPATFADPSGDSGTAPDIQNVVVSNDPKGNITFRVNAATLVVPSGVTIIVAIDSDQNAATGLSGTDYLLAADLSTNKFGVGHWNGTDFVVATTPTASASEDAGGITLAINRSDLDNLTGLNFWVRAVDGTEETPEHLDDAPDLGVWNYQLQLVNPVNLSIAAFGAPTRVRAGRTFSAVLAAKRSDTAGFVGNEGRVQCRATIGGKPIRVLGSGFVTIDPVSAARCTWRVPQKAHGKTIRGSIRVSYQGASVSRRFTAKVT